MSRVTSLSFAAASFDAGFPVSALYHHRTVFEWIVARRATSAPSIRAGSPILSALLRLDSRFVGHERGALGYILMARRERD